MPRISFRYCSASSGRAELQQPGDGVHPVREFVLLGPHRFGEAALAVELAGQARQLGAVLQRDDGAVRSSAEHDRHAVDDRQ